MYYISTNQVAPGYYRGTAQKLPGKYPGAFLATSVHYWAVYRCYLGINLMLSEHYSLFPVQYPGPTQALPRYGLDTIWV